MKHGTTMLWLAGITGIASVMLVSASLTIAVIAAAYPPVSQYLDATQNAQVAANIRRALIPALLTLAFTLLVVIQVVLRRPLFRRHAMAEPGPTNVTIGVAVALVVLCTAFWLWGLADALRSIRLAGARPLTDNLSFSGMSLSLGWTSMVCAVLSNLLLTRWWRDEQAATHPPAPHFAPARA